MSASAMYHNPIIKEFCMETSGKSRTINILAAHMSTVWSQEPQEDEKIICKTRRHTFDCTRDARPKLKYRLHKGRKAEAKVSTAQGTQGRS